MTSEPSASQLPLARGAARDPAADEQRAPPQLVAALRYALHIESMLALATLALTVSLIEWLSTLPVPAAALALPAARLVAAGYLFFVLRKAATGSLRLPQLEDHRDVWDATIVPFAQLVLASAWYVLGVLIVADQTFGLELFAVRYEWRAVELFRQARLAPLAMLGLSLIYLPPALAAAAVTHKLLALLDPSCGLRLLFPVARGYLRVCAGLGALTVLVFVADGLGAALERAVAIPLAAPVMHSLLALWFPLAQARLLGAFLYRQRAALAAR